MCIRDRYGAFCPAHTPVATGKHEYSDERAAGQLPRRRQGKRPVLRRLISSACPADLLSRHQREQDRRRNEIAHRCHHKGRERFVCDTDGEIGRPPDNVDNDECGPSRGWRAAVGALAGARLAHGDSLSGRLRPILLILGPSSGRTVIVQPEMERDHTLLGLTFE